MSDGPQGDGWWIASDGKWYPPEKHPDYKPPPPTAPPPVPPPPPGGDTNWPIVAGVVGGLFLLLLIGLGALVGSGVGSSTHNRAEPLYGTWNVVDAGAHYTFRSDGSWYVARTLGGDPYDTGTYTVRKWHLEDYEGPILTLDTDESSRICPRTTGGYVVTFNDPDTMRLETHFYDECESRGSHLPGVLTRVRRPPKVPPSSLSVEED